MGDINGFITGAASAADAAEAAPAPAVAASAPVAAAPGASAAVAAQVQGVLLEIVAEKTGYPAEMLDPGMDIEADLGIDSIKRVQIMGALQEQYPQAGEVEPERLAELRTLGDIIGFITGAASAADAAEAAPAPAVAASAPVAAAPGASA